MDFRDLLAYRKAYELSMELFEISKSFPKDERYALTDQLRRSSRSVCSNLAEAYRKRAYPNYFFSKLTDSDGENSETAVWIDFALSCNYITNDVHSSLISRSEEIGKLLSFMMQNPGRFGVKTN